MIARLTGKIIELEEKSLIIDVGGVGYRVAVLSKVFSKTKVGSESILLIHHNISDGNEDLYGFENKRDLEYFYLLLTVPSVGPRTAMNILEVAPPETLAQAVTQKDTGLLTKVSGVGRKTAERILVELKGKIQGTVKVASTNIQHEAISALVSIGYTNVQAREEVGKLPQDIKSVEEAVRTVLQNK